MGLIDSLQHGLDRIQHGWNAFKNNRDPTQGWDGGRSYHSRPDRVRFTNGNDRSISTSIFNRLALDAASIDIEHVQLDEDGRYAKTLDSGLNTCLNLEANLDQSGKAFLQDAYMSLFDEGSIAIVPVDTTLDPNDTSSYSIQTMRVGKITEWKPQMVKVQLYNERTGEKEDIWVPKRNAAIVENPFFAVMNQKNSTMSRLTRKLALLDAVDEETSSGKIDMIIQLPYQIRTDARRNQAEQKLKDIENQLTSSSKYGIAYIDATDRVIQLNRPLENNLMKHIEYLTSMVFTQLNITQEIMDGRANEEVMLNYYNRTIEPVVRAVVDEMKRKFLTKTARTQGQSIMYFRDQFSLVSISKIAEIGDSLTRNEIATSNEMRQTIGWKPSKDPRADELRNKNISDGNTANIANPNTQLEEGENQNG